MALHLRVRMQPVEWRAARAYRLRCRGLPAERLVLLYRTQQALHLGLEPGQRSDSIRVEWVHGVSPSACGRHGTDTSSSLPFYLASNRDASTPTSRHCWRKAASLRTAGAYSTSGA